MSPRAAARLATLGFDVYDYAAGKTDWLSANLPREGDAAQDLTAADGARKGLPTAHLGDSAQSVLDRIGDWPQAAVVDEEGVILGRLRKSRLTESPHQLVDELMEEGPSTTRPDEPLRDTVAGMGDVRYRLVTTSDGVLIGLLDREEAKKQVDAAPTAKA